MDVKAYDMRFIKDIGDKAMALLSTMHKGANANGCSIVCYENHANMKVFNESGHEYWLEGFGCLRADGGFNDSNTSHDVCYEVQMDAMGFDAHNLLYTGGVSMTMMANRSDTHSVPVAYYPVESIGHDIRSTQFSKGECCDTLTANDYKDPVIVAYSIGSMNSKGMLSKNPTAGYHETDVARTIDANGSNPAGYQGGDVVLVFKERAGKPGGGKGILIGEDKSFTLDTQMIDAVCYQNSTGVKE